MRCVYYYSENNRVLSRRLKLSVLSIGSCRSSLSEFQAVLGRQQQMPEAHTSWDCVEAQRGNDAWQNEDVVDWPHRRLEYSSPSSTRGLVMKAVMHHRHRLELHLFRHIEPMKVDMHKLLQTVIELSCITNKTCSHIQETTADMPTFLL